MEIAMEAVVTKTGQAAMNNGSLFTRPGPSLELPVHTRPMSMSAASPFLADYRAAAAEREALGVPALPLNAAQTGALVELLAAPAAAFPRCGGPTWAAWRR